MRKTERPAGRRFQLILIKPSHYDDRRLCRAVAALDHAVELACRRLQPRQGGGRAQHISAPICPSTSYAIDETNTRVRAARRSPPHRRQRRPRAGRDYRRAVERIPPRARHRPAVARRGRPGGDRRLPRLRLPGHAEGDPEPTSKPRRISASRSSPARPRKASTRCCTTPRAASFAALQSHEATCRASATSPPRPSCRSISSSARSATSTSFDAGRGCPFQCSFCTIINVQGRKSRYRSPDSVEQILRMNWAQGVKRFFITDDNFARNKDWEAIYDRIIKLREEDGMDVRFMIQVDTLCHKIPNFIEKSQPRRRHPRVHRAREHQPGESDRRQEAAEQDHRVSQDAARVEAGRHHDLRRLHPRLPQRHAGIDPARPRDHQEGAAARHARVLRADAAAGLGGPQGAARERGLDGPRHEQIRARARRHRPPQDDARKNGRGPTAPPGASSTPRTISRRSCAAPMPAASTSAR